jgi:VWFA-related protein
MSEISGKILPFANPRALAALLALALLAPVAPVASRAAQSGAGEGFVQLDLPSSGAVRIENQRGGVRVEVWGGQSLAVAARFDEPATRGASAEPGAADSPVRFDRTDSLLTISVARAAAGVAPAPAPRSKARGVRRRPPSRAAASGAAQPRVDLLVRVPRHARVEVSTAAGDVEVRGLPARLDAQTASGDLRLAVPPDADVMARTLDGAITVGAGLDPAGPPRTLRDRFHLRLDAGTRVARLSTAHGNIDLQAWTNAPRPAETAPAPDGPAGARDADARAGAGRSRRASLPPATTESVSRGRELGETSPPRLDRDDGAANSTGRPPSLIGAGASSSSQPPTATRTPTPDAPIEVDPDELLTVDTNLVTLNFSVVDRQSGRVLAGLIGGDFKVFEDGVEQQISHFESANAPFDLLLLLDLSGSTSRVTDLIRASAQRFVDSVRPNDRVGVVAFAADTRVVSPLTSDKSLLRSRLSSLGAPQGDTKLYDAVNFALEHLAANSPRERRRAVVLLTDGLDSALPNVQGDGSALSYKELRRRVQEFDGLFYAVVTDNYQEPQSPLDTQPETFDLAYDRMEELAADAGGLYYEAERLEDVAGIYARVVEDLGTVYSIAYLPANKTRDGRWRSVRVRLPRRPTAIARGRSGYYAK